MSNTKPYFSEEKKAPAGMSNTKPNFLRKKWGPGSGPGPGPIGLDLGLLGQSFFWARAWDRAGPWPGSKKGPWPKRAKAQGPNGPKRTQAGTRAQ